MPRWRFCWRVRHMRALARIDPSRWLPSSQIVTKVQLPYLYLRNLDGPPFENKLGVGHIVSATPKPIPPLGLKPSVGMTTTETLQFVVFAISSLLRVHQMYNAPSVKHVRAVV